MQGENVKSISFIPTVIAFITLTTAYGSICPVFKNPLNMILLIC